MSIESIPNLACLYSSVHWAILPGPDCRTFRRRQVASWGLLFVGSTSSAPPQILPKSYHTLPATLAIQPIHTMQSFSRATRARSFFRFSHLPTTRRQASAFAQGPAPPRLPKEEQELYEKLKRSSTGAFSTPQPVVVVNPAASSPESSQPGQRPQINQSPHSPSTSTPESSPPSPEWTERTLNARVEARGEGEELHPDVRRGTRPEFEGEKNPKTGEVGGPKNEPLRWGGGVDWSYNGRVTDF